MIWLRLFAGKQETDQRSRFWFNFRKALVLLLLVAVFCLVPLGLKGWNKKSLVQNIRSHGGKVQFGHGNCKFGICSVYHPKMEVFTGAINSISSPDSADFPINDEFIESLGNQPHLQALTLGNTQNPSKITDRGLAALSKYPLIALSIQGGSITNAGLKTLENISSLKRLGLHDLVFDIEEFESSLLLQILNSLTVSGPQITDHDLSILVKAPLSSLRITGSAITDSGFNELQNLSNLQNLCIHNSNFTGEIFECAATMKNLNYLDLSGSKITDAGLEKISYIPNLKYLDLSKTCVEGEGFRHLSKLKKLAHLSLRDSEINADSLKYLAEMESLTHLIFVGKSINDAHVQQIGSLQQITFLTLLDSLVTDQGLIPLTKMQNLDRLFLTNTQISNEGLKHLIHIDSLLWLGLSNTNITDQAKESLLLMPQLEIVTVNGTKLSASTIESLRNSGIKVNTN